MNTLKASNLKNKPRNTWSKFGFTVYHLANGFWVSSFEFTDNFKTIGEVKTKINELRR